MELKRIKQRKKVISATCEKKHTPTSIPEFLCIVDIGETERERDRVQLAKAIFGEMWQLAKLRRQLYLDSYASHTARERERQRGRRVK